MLKAYEEIQGTTLMEGTNVSESEILEAVITFNRWAIEHPGVNLVTFFKKRKVSTRVQQAFALLGMKAAVDEFYTNVKKEEEKKND